MSRRVRLVLFAVFGAATAVLLVTAFFDLPHFGNSVHPYRDLAVPTSLRERTANVVSSVNFDQRAFDTLGEETILLTSVLGVATLLRVSKDETEERTFGDERVLEVTRLIGYVLLPVTLMLGVNLVVNGHLTPGGGFQGGVVLATGVHLLYLTGNYDALNRIRPIRPYELTEAAGAAAFAAIAVAAVISGATFFANFLPLGQFRDLVSSGTVPLLNVAVGIEVASGMVVLLSSFLEQAIRIAPGTGERDS